MRKTQTSSRTGGDTQYLVEKISQLDLRAWKGAARKVGSFHIRLFYYLAGMRADHAQEIRDALWNSKTDAFKRDRWYRIVNFQYSDNPLSPKGSLINGGRFNYGSDIDPKTFHPFQALYIAEDEATAYAERFTSSSKNKSTSFKPHELALRTEGSYSVVAVNFDVANILDISNERNLQAFVEVVSKFPMPEDLKRLGQEIGRQPPWLIVSTKELKEIFLDDNWRSHPMQFDIPSNPQILGKLLFDAGFEGVIYPSSKAARKKCVAVFSENFENSNSFVELADPAHAGVIHTRLDSQNCRTIIGSDSD